MILQNTTHCHDVPQLLQCINWGCGVVSRKMECFQPNNCTVTIIHMTIHYRKALHDFKKITYTQNSSITAVYYSDFSMHRQQSSHTTWHNKQPIYVNKRCSPADSKASESTHLFINTMWTTITIQQCRRLYIKAEVLDCFVSTAGDVYELVSRT